MSPRNTSPLGGGICGNPLYSCTQWNLSITDTLEIEKQFVIERFPLFRGCFMYMAIHSGPQVQFVIERFPLLGEFVMRDFTVLHLQKNLVSKNTVNE